MPSRNRGPNSAQLWGLDDVTATRPRSKPRSKPPSRPPAPPQIPEPLAAQPTDERSSGDFVLLLSVEDAGKALGVSRSTVYELIGSGDLEVVHIRRSVRVPIDAVHDFVRRLRMAGTPSPTMFPER